MATVIIKTAREVILESKIVSITPLGFECEINQENIAKLRDESGKLHKLDCELYLGSQDICITGTVSVNSIRRVAQDVSLLLTRFTSLEQGAYLYIAEYISNGKVISFHHSANKRRA